MYIQYTCTLCMRSSGRDRFTSVSAGTWCTVYSQLGELVSQRANRQARFDAGAPQRAVQLCYWQIGAGQRAAGLFRPWHIKAPGPIASPPVAPRPATSKRLQGASQIPIKGPGCSAHPRKQTSQEDMIKSILWGKGGRTEKRFSSHREGYLF